MKCGAPLRLRNRPARARDGSQVRQLPMRVNLRPGCLRPGGTDRSIGVGTIVLRSPLPPNRTGGFPASGSPVDRVYSETDMPNWTWEPQQESSRFGDIGFAFPWCLTAFCGSLPAMDQGWLEGTPLHSLRGTEFSTLV